MHKPFRSVDDQIRLLEKRGISCGVDTREALLREGYYAVVNGYNQPFIDVDASTEAGDDRFVAGPTFADLYALCVFDRDLRSATFRALMEVESTMRSLLAYCFCEVHRGVEDYLRPTCYTDKAHYLRGRENYEGDLEWMVKTLEHNAHTHEEGETDVRVAWYQQMHDGVPLWILMNDLTFGNLRYFYALMRPEEQRRVVERLCACLGNSLSEAPTDPRDVYNDLILMVAVRNVCAHEERLYNARFGDNDAFGYPEFLQVVRYYLTPAAYLRLVEDIRAAARRCLTGNANLRAAVERVTP